MATRPRRRTKRVNSHERFVHDSIDGLGYDWERVADPDAPARLPLRVYLPRSTEDVVLAVNEARSRGERPTVRALGHSSNDLVVRGGGTLLLTQKLDQVLEVDEVGLTVTAQPGIPAAQVDDLLAERGLGLGVIGDHAHVTLGGFASVGGISAASFRNGMFVDLIERLELVTWDGEVVRCSRTERPDDFYGALLGLGRHGVITALTVRVERVDKVNSLWCNRITHHRSLDSFLATAVPLLASPPPEARFMRGMWVDVGNLGLGQFSVYEPTEPTLLARAVNDAGYGLLHGLGAVAGRLPAAIDRPLKYVGLLGILFPPRYASQTNAEPFSDRIIDATVGEPSRHMVAIARLSRLEETCRRLLGVLSRYREDEGCFTALALFVQGIKSPILARRSPSEARWAEVFFNINIRPERMTEPLMNRIAAEFDDVCIDTGSFRYMYTRTSRDPARQKLVDPHTLFENGEPEEVPHGA